MYSRWEREHAMGASRHVACILLGQATLAGQAGKVSVGGGALYARQLLMNPLIQA